MLAHVASYEGEVAVKDIFTGQGEANYTAVPSSLYTHPELASVGITEAQAKEQGLKYKVGKFPFSANGRALTKGEAYGMVKILADEETGKVLGAHILGPQASELIQTLTLAIRWGLTVEQITETIHGHPTLSEAIMESAHSVFGKAIHFL
jgi:dihydrolipoamide dehydrogenase